MLQRLQIFSRHKTERRNRKIQNCELIRDSNLPGNLWNFREKIPIVPYKFVVM